MILFQTVQHKEYLVIVIAAVHDKSGFSEKSSSLTDGIKCNGIYRFITFLGRRMDPAEDTDRMFCGGQGTGFRYMVSFL